MMHTVGPFGTSSAGVKSRPRAGGMPSVLKKPELTRRLLSCAGCSPAAVNVKLSNALTASAENECDVRSSSA